jgi:hypothetical protein
MLVIGGLGVIKLLLYLELIMKKFVKIIVMSPVNTRNAFVTYRQVESLTMQKKYMIVLKIIFNIDYEKN